MNNIFFKGTGESVQSGSAGEDPLGFALFLTLTALFAVAHLSLLNKGLERYDGTLFYPLYCSSFIVCGIVCGGVFYREFECFQGLQAFLFGAGNVTTVVGMLWLAKIKGQKMKEIHPGPAAGDGTPGAAESLAHALDGAPD
jgi:hypothetical protein